MTILTRKKFTLSKIFRTRLVVEGSGDFPIDMLRYDGCCPDGEVDSWAIQNEKGQRQVKLRRFTVAGSRAAEGRWESFGWKVVSEEPVIEI
jgi:hypothetical protein